MQTQINRRFSKGLMFGVAWTWSKSMNFVNGNNDAINPFLDFRDRNYGKAATDRLHNFVMNYTYNIPGLGKRLGSKPLGWILDNWDISGVTSFISGAPLALAIRWCRRRTWWAAVARAWIRAWSCSRIPRFPKASGQS